MSALDLDASIRATLAMRPVRDPNPEFECYSFTQERVLSSDCEGDGHYLCRHCSLYKPVESE